MIARLALAALTRRRTRTALTIAGVAVAAAMLLDMVMLGSGMRESFRGFIDQQGFQLRLAPRGTMPFDSEATVGGATALVAALRADPDIARVGPVLGGKHFVSVDTGVVAGFLLGIDPTAQGDYRLEAGRDPAAPTRWSSARRGSPRRAVPSVTRCASPAATTRSCAAPPANAPCGSSAADASRCSPRTTVPRPSRSPPRRRWGRRPHRSGLRAPRGDPTRIGRRGRRAADRSRRTAAHRALHRGRAQVRRRTARLLPPTRLHPRLRVARRRVPPRHHPRDRLRERAHRRDRRHARHRRGPWAHRHAGRPRGVVLSSSAPRSGWGSAS